MIDFDKERAEQRERVDGRAVFVFGPIRVANREPSISGRSKTELNMLGVFDKLGALPPNDVWAGEPC